MWTCGEVKKQGWSNLSKSLWTGVLITLVFLFISGFFAYGQNFISTYKLRLQFSGNMSSMEDLKSYLSNYGTNSSALMNSSSIMLLNLMSSLLGLLSLAATFLLINPISVGYSRWFLTNRREGDKAEFNLLFSSFRQGSYTGILAGTAWMTLWTLIWSLVGGLFFIPLYIVIIVGIFSVVFAAGTYAGSGVTMDQSVFMDKLTGIAPGLIIAFVIVLLVGIAGYLAIVINRKYAYFFTTFILAENPTIGAKNALDLSKRMTQGMKGHLFVLDLSFIGWWLLSSLTCGILSLGVVPYTYAAYTEVYMRRKAEQNI